MFVRMFVSTIYENGFRYVICVICFLKWMVTATERCNNGGSEGGSSGSGSGGNGPNRNWKNNTQFIYGI